MLKSLILKTCLKTKKFSPGNPPLVADAQVGLFPLLQFSRVFHRVGGHRSLRSGFDALGSERFSDATGSRGCGGQGMDALAF